MSDVFLSYASEDRAREEPLVQALRTEGLEVFWDQSIRVGDQWRKVLRQEIAQAKCVLAAWSRHSADSRWVELEAGEAQAMKKFVSAKIDAVEIPFGFGLDQIADLSRCARPRSRCAARRRISRRRARRATTSSGSQIA